jgi:Glycosyl transferases group 1
LRVDAMSSTRETLDDQHNALRGGWRGKLRQLEGAWPMASAPRLTLRALRVDCKVLFSEWRARGGTVRVGEPKVRRATQGTHIFAVVPAGGWETHNLVPALKAFGQLNVFDPTPKRGVTDRMWLQEQRGSTNAALRAAFEAACQTGAVQLVFGYVSNWLVEPASIEFMRRSGAFTFGFSLDDRLSFSEKRAGIDGAIAPLVPTLSLCGTSATRSLRKYLALRGKSMFFPEGADENVFHPTGEAEDLDAVFVGQRYGWRPYLLWQLQRAGVRVEAFGPGWPNGPVSVEEMNRLYSRAKVVIGVSGIQQSLYTTCLKGRDFEVAMSGGIYVAQRDPDLASFAPELLAALWSTPDQLVSAVRHVLRWDPERRARHRQQVRELALRRHTWRHRVAAVLAASGIDPVTTDGQSVAPWPEPIVYESA